MPNLAVVMYKMKLPLVALMLLMAASTRGREIPLGESQRNQEDFILSERADTTLITTDGKYLRKSNTNVDCCLTYSIFESEDGTNYRWPLVSKAGSCAGGFKKNLQEWIDLYDYNYSYNYEGLCYENWFYKFQATAETTTIATTTTAMPECKCIDYVTKWGKGNCLKPSKRLGGKLFCYVKQPSGCRDVRDSSDAPGQQYSAQACQEGCPAKFATAKTLYCHGTCGDDWLDNKHGCQQADADAYCMLKLCDEKASASSFDVITATHQPGFACDGRGKNYGNWFGMRSVYFEDDVRTTHGAGKVVSNVDCQTSDTTGDCSCSTFEWNGYGPMCKQVFGKGPICYVNEPSTCTDIVTSGSMGPTGYSWEACSKG